MKKDIDIPEVNNVHVAAVREKHPEFSTMDWNAYIINDREIPLEIILIVSKGSDKNSVTSAMRHSINVLPPKSYAKIEFLQEDVLRLANRFSVTFFAEGKMFEKTFVFPENVIREEDVKELPVLDQKGILAD